MSWNQEEWEMRYLPMVLLAVAVSACGSGSPSGREVSAPVLAKTYGERVAALPDGERRAVFLRAIRDSGIDCQHVGSAVRTGNYRGFPVWQATCRGGSAWTIVITGHGVAQVLSAAEAGEIERSPAGAAPTVSR